jgi:hypothetical protein
MFGFLSPDRCAASSRKYRQAYARLCRFQKLIYGAESLFLLSYEAVFLYLLTVDSGAIPPPADDEVMCCRLRRRGLTLNDEDAEVARFCVAFGVLLARVKLEDDWRDEKSWLAGLLKWRLKKQFVANAAYLDAFDSRLRPAVAEAVEQHLRLERQPGRIALPEYVAPTGNAFAAVFMAASGVCPTVERSLLKEVGRSLGSAIVAFDAAVDWQRDRRRGSYNPLHAQEDVDAAFAFALEQLSVAGWICNDSLTGSLAQEVIQYAIQRVQVARDFHRDPPRSSDQITPRRRWRRTEQPLWGIPLTSRAGFCDCDCGCDGCGGGCDLPCSGDAVACGDGGAQGGAPCRTGCCDCCVLCDCCVPDRKRKSSKLGAKSPSSLLTSLPGNQASLLNKLGRTTTALTPAGFVLIGDKQHPAKCESGFILLGADVEVMREEAFGVVVRRIAD